MRNECERGGGERENQWRRASDPSERRDTNILKATEASPPTRRSERPPPSQRTRRGPESEWVCRDVISGRRKSRCQGNIDRMKSPKGLTGVIVVY